MHFFFSIWATILAFSGFAPSEGNPSKAGKYVQEDKSLNSK